MNFTRLTLRRLTHKGKLSGHDSGDFLETFSEIKDFQILEKVSGKASESWPVFGKKYFFMGKYSWNLPGNSFRKIPWVTPQNCKIWKKSGKSFRDIPWVTARFLEIVSGICLYGLSWNQKGSLNPYLRHPKIKIGILMYL